MTPEELAANIRQIILDGVGDGSIACQVDDVPEKIKVERPRQREHGDWSTNIALQLAKKAQTNPRALAALLAERLAENPGIDAVDVAGPGFVNIKLSAGSAGQLARTIIEAGSSYGHSDSMKGIHINLEFVSANPTGPVHLGGARWAAVGDTMARTMEAAGATVTREYYFNDHGSQIDRFAISLLARARGEETPEDGYGGQYISDIAQTVIDNELAAGRPNPLELDDDAAQEVFRARGVDLMFDQIKDRLKAFGVDFDVFFHEESLHKSGAVTRAVDMLRQRGMIYEEDGATWLKTSQFGDDKDRVLFKSDGQPAYFAADVAYYLDKRDRGSDCSIYLLGADHHGYVGRMMAMCAAFGDTPGKNMQIIIGQMVNLLKGGAPVRMSKRAGNVVTLDDLVDAVGVDAARYSLTRSSMDSNIDIDIDLLSQRTNENPVYYVQYAHARTCSVARNAQEAGVSAEGFDPACLDDPADADLLGVLAKFPSLVDYAAQLREPHRINHYLEDLAAAYHGWYSKTRVTPRGDQPVDGGHCARLALNNATRQVLANGLYLLGVSAPERM